MSYGFNIQDAIAGYIWHHVLDSQKIFEEIYDSNYYETPYFEAVGEEYADLLKENYPQYVDLALDIRDWKSYNKFYDIAYDEIKNNDEDIAEILSEIDTEIIYTKVGDFITEYDSYGTYTLPYDVMDAVCPQSPESDKFFDSISEIGENNIVEAYKLFDDNYVGSKDLNEIAADIVLKKLESYDNKNYK